MKKPENTKVNMAVNLQDLRVLEAWLSGHGAERHELVALHEKVLKAKRRVRELIVQRYA